MRCLTLISLAFAIVVLAAAEPTPQPSVEPTTQSAIPSSTTEASDLTGEGQDQVAILKQINKVNDDGSYTFGYEAADGSFKIETRDVAGNVKGMFGFIDEGGELKRVSYTASNGTGFQSTGSPNIPSIISTDDVKVTSRLPPFQSNTEGPTTRISLLPTDTTDRPALPIYIYKSTTAAPKPEVIQHIPKLRPTPASYSTEPTESEEVTNVRRPTYGSELLPKKSATPNYISLKSTTRSPEDVEDERRPSSVIQSIRPRGYKKVIVTKRPSKEFTPTPTVSSTTEYYPLTYSPQLINEEVTRHNELQRQVDSNSVTEGGLLTSGTEDSPDVYGGGPTPRPYPAGAYRALFSPIPQYQRILQSSYLQNQYGSPGGQPPLPPQPYNPSLQGPINQGIPNRFQDPAAIAQYAQYAAGRPQQVPYPPEAQNPNDPYPPEPPALPINRQSLAQPPINSQNYPPNGNENLPYPPPPPAGPPAYRPSTRPNFPRRQPQTLPPPSYNPAQGLGPEEPVPNPAEVDQRRPYPIPAQYNPNLPPYGPPNANPQRLLMETLLMLLAQTQQRQQQPPLSPFQQALLSTLGPNNVPQELLGRGYDPRSSYPNYGQYQRAPYYPQPPYDPRYDPRYQQYAGYPDPYAQAPPYPNNYNNPYYQQPPYPNPNLGYSPNPYYQPRPEDALLQMLLGARFSPPAPQANPQIQTSPAAFDNSPASPPRPPIRALDPNGRFGQRIPGGSNIVERSSNFVNKESPAYQRTRSKGSRNVQIIEQSTSESSTTTSKP